MHRGDQILGPPPKSSVGDMEYLKYRCWCLCSNLVICFMLFSIPTGNYIDDMDKQIMIAERVSQEEISSLIFLIPLLFIEIFKPQILLYES